MKSMFYETLFEVSIKVLLMFNNYFKFLEPVILKLCLNSYTTDLMNILFMYSLP